MFGGFLTPPLIGVLQGKLHQNAVTMLQQGAKINPSEALKQRIIDDTYDGEPDLKGKIRAFVQRYAEMGKHRFAI